MKDKLRYVPVLLLLVALVAVGYVLTNYESEFLWKVQELNLHLHTPLFFRQQMVASGWLLTWLGTYFTEFFYHPWLGATMLCAWWALLMLVVGRAFRVPAKWALLLLVPVALLLLTDMDMGYWIYYLKLRGHFFAATIGTTLAVGAVWLFRLVTPRYSIRLLFLVLSAVVLYPLIGFYGLMATVLMGILVWRLTDMTLTGKIVATALALLSAGVVPLFYYRFVFHETNLINIYWTGLPLYFVTDSNKAYYIPYYILGGFLAALAIAYRPERTSAVKRPFIWGLCQVLLLVGIVWGTHHYWYKDYNFHKELRMQRCMEQLDWDGILAEARDLQDEPTRAIVMMKNLALFRLGRQGDEMYHYLTGAKASQTPIPVHMTQIVGRSIYYNYGQLNYCYRWCLEDGVEFGWRTEYLKYLIRCALVNGEKRVARKYINLLKQTRYQKMWAEQYERFLDDDKALRSSEEMKPIFHLMDYGDRLSSDNSLLEQYLMNLFANTQSEDTLFQEQTVLSALWTKDIQTFWPRFFHYARLHPDEHMPIHFQEAAYLYGHLEHEVDISRMPFDEQVVKNYNDFMAMANQYAGMSEDKLRVIMYPRFGKTFYYEYFLIRNQKLY